MTGAKRLTRTDEGIGELSDLAGRSIGVRGGTTSESALRLLLAEQGLTAKITLLESYVDGIAALEEDEIDAVFGDRVLLTGLAQRAMDPMKLKMLRPYFSYEPYGLMVRRDDDDLLLMVNRTLARLYRSGEVIEIHQTWMKPSEPEDMLLMLYEMQALPEE
jgi:glutamate/aspartate transport system substrate-binding protein